ncbi:MAG: dioxygenase [Hyphomicrobiales bacterium]|nr:VOC family protein [Hyphomicrobiales bacterium]PCH50071.1 MAG: dioxygenase [Hyphomicrobiales bacterium]PCH50504.1 MAG: dioxygenase [Hyphomicrobiales bacterium]
MSPFHYAFYVNDLAETEAFYTEILSAKIGRKSKTWVDFSLFGHQLSAHINPNKVARVQSGGNVDGKQVPMPHFGVILQMDEWKALAKSLDEDHTIDWVIEPHVRFEGQSGEQGTFFLYDPSGNALEFKGFADLNTIFES